MLRRGVRRLCAAGGPPKPPIVVLGLQPSATPAEIRSAYRRLAKKHHPDAGGDRKRFEDVHEAYKALEAAEWNTGIGAPPPAGEPQEDTFGTPGFDPTKGGAKQYATGTEAATLRLVVVWCALFAIARLFLQKVVFPPPKGYPEEAFSLDGNRRVPSPVLPYAKPLPATGQPDLHTSRVPGDPLAR
jgi:hypothetical protein